MFRLFFGFLLVIGASTAFAEGDAARGKGMTTVCAACHGADGNSPAGTFPSLAGQNAKYLQKQMNDIKSGAREVAVMAGQLDALSGQDMEDIAAYFASQKPKGGAAKADLVDEGETIYRAGVARKNIAACTACHGPKGEGLNDAKFPALAGQWPEYVEAQLKAFRTGMRHNDGESKMMRSTAMDLSDEEISAVASYIYGLR
ncbi:MAG: cytochrome c4 [Pseudomonadales bacterium]|nr:cytochrome c4 [Pseudomonadales bacterium]